MNLNEMYVVAVDDEKFIITHLEKNLSKHCKKFISFVDSQKAFEFININYQEIDIVISDIRMSYLNGIDLAKSIKSINKNIIVMLLSASNDIDYLVEAINMGVDKFISKPYRITTLLEILEHYAKNIVNGKNTEKLKINEEIRNMQESIICMLGNVIENRSKEISLHVKRVALYSEVIGKNYGLEEYQSNLLKLASILHDVGKISISDSILNKPSVLNNDEFEIIKTHTTVGYEILKNSGTEIFNMAANIALSHHENWDGTGYPHGLIGEQIVLEASIIALCDVFDALAHNRCYKKAWSIEKIIQFIQEQKGKKFDPKLVDIFLNSIDTILQIHEQYDEK